METLEKFTEAHHALIRRCDAERLGITKSEFDATVRRGTLERVGYCVYRVRGSVPTWRQRLLAAVWAAGDDALAAHRSAVALWRQPGFPHGPIEVCRLRHGSGFPKRALIRETSYLPAHHRVEVDGIPVTSPARTLLDLCGIVHPQRADRALENALSSRLVSYPEMITVLAESARQGRDGIALLRALLAKRGDRYVPTESELERLVLAVLEAAGLPAPERQVVLGDNEHIAGRVDFLYRAARLVIEADGRQHGGFLAAAEDARRDAILHAGGYEVIRVTWRMLIEEPELFVNAVRGALRRHAAA